MPQIGVRVNSHGLRPLHLWQMDVTHFSDFGKLKYPHASIDTASGVIFASLHTGEKARHVIAHCFEAWGAWGQPKELKTDNGPVYTSASFVSFCKMVGVRLTHGLPYNPQGQGIIEQAHRILKECLIKQKGGIASAASTPRERLALPFLP
jgi:transposase InsO family protein